MPPYKVHFVWFSVFVIWHWKGICLTCALPPEVTTDCLYRLSRQSLWRSDLFSYVKELHTWNALSRMKWWSYKVALLSTVKMPATNLIQFPSGKWMCSLFIKSIFRLTFEHSHILSHWKLNTCQSTHDWTHCVWMRMAQIKSRVEFNSIDIFGWGWPIWSGGATCLTHWTKSPHFLQ